MSDILEELLTDLREGAVREIRPPGAAAARRTVRRRRVTTVVASACAVLVAVGGAFALVNRPAAEGNPVLPAATTQSPAPSGPEQLAATALARITDGTPGLDVAEPVTAGYERKERMYLPQLTLRAACAGTGQITLVVMGDVENDLNNRSKDRERVRVTIPCGADPAPVTQKINASTLNDLTFRLVGAESAAGKAGFAYRVTAEGGAPLAPHDPAANVAQVLSARDETARGGGGAPDHEPFGKLNEASWHAEFPDELYTLALACRGEGTYRLQIRRGTEVLADHSVRCSWPPRRVAFELPEPLGKNVTFYDQYDADPDQRAETGWVLHVRD